MRMLRAFAHPPFRRLWLAAMLIQLGQWFLTVTFQWILPHETDADSLLLGLLYFAMFLPFMLFSLLAGAVADNNNRRTVLLVSQTIALGLALVAITLSLADLLSPIPVLLLGFASGCVVTFTSPASHALTANAVPREDLSSAVPVQSMAINLARIVGPAIAGTVLLAVDVTGAFVTYVGSTLIALVLIRQIRVQQTFPTGSRERLTTRIRLGMSHARERYPTIPILAVVAVTSFFGNAFQSQLPVIGAHISENGDRAFITLVVLTGVGSLIGVTRVAQLRQLPTFRSITLGLAMLGVSVMGMGLSTNYWLTLVCTTAGGALLFLVMTSANTMIQHLVDDDRRGRVLSLYFLGWGGLLPIGGLLIGALIAATNMSLALITFGAVTTIGGGAIWLYNRRNQAKNL